MKRLAVLRHAKSSWDEPPSQDLDRPLNPRGWKAARQMGREMKQRRMHFDLVLASTAARVRETIDGLREQFVLNTEIRFDPAIYMASGSDLLELVRTLPGSVKNPLLVGHNPGLQELLLALSRDHGKGLRNKVEHKFPTAALALVDLPVEEWFEVAPATGEIVDLILPRELD